MCLFNHTLSTFSLLYLLKSGGKPHAVRFRFFGGGDWIEQSNADWLEFQARAKCSRLPACLSETWLGGNSLAFKQCNVSLLQLDDASTPAAAVLVTAVKKCKCNSFLGCCSCSPAQCSLPAWTTATGSLCSLLLRLSLLPLFTGQLWRRPFKLTAFSLPLFYSFCSPFPSPSLSDSSEQCGGM